MCVYVCACAHACSCVCARILPGSPQAIKETHTYLVKGQLLNRSASLARVNSSRKGQPDPGVYRADTPTRRSFACVADRPPPCPRLPRPGQLPWRGRSPDPQTKGSGTFLPAQAGHDAFKALGKVIHSAIRYSVVAIMAFQKVVYHDSCSCEKKLSFSPRKALKPLRSAGSSFQSG